MATTLYLIRHGETDWNATGRWQGHADTPLNRKGQRQAELLAQYAADQGMTFDGIYSSDLTRAYQTAWELGAAVRVPVQLLPPLREIDIGTWSGLTINGIREKYPVDYALLEQGQDTPRGGGETNSAFARRIIEVTDAMVGQHPNKTLVFVTHGGVIRVMVRHALGHPQEYSQPPHGHIGNTSLTVVHATPAKWQVVSFNAMPHLANLDAELISAPPDDTESISEHLM